MKNKKIKRSIMAIILLVILVILGLLIKNLIVPKKEVIDMTTETEIFYSGGETYMRLGKAIRSNKCY